MPEGFCFAASLPLFSRGHTLHVSICVFSVLFSFVNLLFLACFCLLAFSLLFVLLLRIENQDP
jgi:hypothetical protein